MTFKIINKLFYNKRTQKSKFKKYNIKYIYN